VGGVHNKVGAERSGVGVGVDKGADVPQRRMDLGSSTVGLKSPAKRGGGRRRGLRRIERALCCKYGITGVEKVSPVVFLFSIYVF